MMTSAKMLRMMALAVAMLMMAIAVVRVSAHGGHDHSHDHDHSHATDDSAVVKLTSSTFHEHVETQPITLVEFFAPWCGHCQRLAPQYAEAARTLGSEASLASVDCTVEKDLCTEFGVRGFPTLKVFRGGAANEDKAPADYKGGRTTLEIVTYMRKLVAPSAYTVESAEQLAKLIADNEALVLGLFADAKSADAATFVAVAEALRENSAFAIASDVSLLAAYPSLASTVTSAPAVVLFATGGKGEATETAVYPAGEIVADALKQWVNAESFPVYSEIGPHNYQRFVDRGLPLVWTFVDPASPDVAAHHAAVRGAAAAFKGLLMVVYLSGVQYGDHAKHFGLMNERFPSLAIEDREAQKNFIFPGEWTTAALSAFFQQFVDKTLVPHVKTQPVPESNDGPVTVVVGSTFEQIVLDDSKDVFVEFYAPWCGHCKALAPKWDELGEIFADNENVVIAKVDATENDTPAKVRGFPTLFLYPAGGKSSPVEFQGDRTPAAMAAFVRANGGTFRAEREATIAAAAATATADAASHDEL